MAIKGPLKKCTLAGVFLLVVRITLTVIFATNILNSVGKYQQEKVNYFPILPVLPYMIQFLYMVQVSISASSVSIAKEALQFPSVTVQKFIASPPDNLTKSFFDSWANVPHRMGLRSAILWKDYQPIFQL